LAQRARVWLKENGDSWRRRIGRYPDSIATEIFHRIQHETTPRT